MFFELHFKFWDEVDAETITIERRPVGKLYVTVQKLTNPARWKQLWLEGSPKPSLMRLWFEKHSRYYHDLSEFEDDDIEDFAGHDVFEHDEQQDEEEDEMAWLNPPKGPGKFKDLKKKKKGKKGRKGKKKGKWKKNGKK